MKGLQIGHSTLAAQGSGASVFLFEKPAVGAYCLCGSSPATHELEALSFEANVTHVDGLAFLGGSAFGLPAVNGVLRWFRQKQQGWLTPHGRVPIVPAAAIYDLGVNSDLPPTEKDVFAACISASENNQETGRIGAGTGASIGKIIQTARRSSGGLGRAEITLANGVSVLAYAVVNAIGDIRDPHGQIIAGGRLADGSFADSEKYLLSGASEELSSYHNTTLVAVFTNARFSKFELKRIAKMAVAGVGRAIFPVFSRYDGDIVFAFSLGEETASELMVGTLAAHLIQQAILNAVTDSIILA